MMIVTFLIYKYHVQTVRNENAIQMETRQANYP